MTNPEIDPNIENRLIAVLNDLFSMERDIMEAYQPMKRDSPSYIILHAIRDGLSVPTEILYQYLYGSLRDVRR